MKRTEPSQTVQPLLLRAREVAALLSVSESQVAIWSRSGILTPIRIIGIRAVRFTREDVEALAREWRAAASLRRDMEEATS